MRAVLAGVPVLRLLLVATAFWPVWPWLCGRVAADPEAPWAALIALPAAIAALRARGGAPGWLDLVPAGCAFACAAGWGSLPPLVRALLAVLAVAATLAPDPRVPGAAGAWGMFLLAVPMVASLQFYFGWPLRVVASALAAGLLRGAGFAVARDGAMLVSGGIEVAVDAPCSGARFLWTSLALGCALAAFRRLSLARSAATVAGAIGVAVVANALRAAALFYAEAGALSLPEFAHAGTGVVAFILAAAALERLARPAPEAAA